MPTIADYRNKFPSLRDLDDDALIGRVAEVQGVDREDVIAHMGYKPKTRNPAAFANDTVIEFANAVAGGVKSAADFVRPGNALSSFIDEKIIKPGEANQSDLVRAEKERYRSEMEAADGIGGEIGSTLGYVARNPVQSLAQAAGSFVLPGAAVKGGGLLSSLAGAGAKGVATGGLAGGAVAGAALSGGDAAGTAYELVKRAGGTEDEAVEAARRASVLPAAIGAAGGVVGAERLLAGAGGFKGGMLGRALKTAGVEGAQEAVEEGVTQYEGQRAAVPFDPTIDPMKGVAGAATMGAVLGGATGAGVSLLSGKPAEAPSKTAVDVLAAPDLDTAIEFATEAVAKPEGKAAEALERAKSLDLAPIGKELGDGLEFSASPASANVLPADAAKKGMFPAFRTKQAADIYIGDQALLGSYDAVEVEPGRWEVRPNAATAAALYRSDKLPVGEAIDFGQTPLPDARELTDEERVAYANRLPFTAQRAIAKGIPTPDAAEIEPEVILADDLILVAKDGEPFGNRTSAYAKAFASGGGKVVAIPGYFGDGKPGFVVRQTIEGRPNNTRGTNAADVIRTGGQQPADAGRSAGTAVTPDNGPADVLASPAIPAGQGMAGAGAAGDGAARQGALTVGTPFEMDGKRWTVASVVANSAIIADEAGNKRMVAGNSKTMQKIIAAIQAAPETAAPAVAAADEGTTNGQEKGRQGLQVAPTQRAGETPTAGARELRAGPTEQPTTAQDAQPTTTPARTQAPAPTAATEAPAAAAPAGPASVEADGVTGRERHFASSGYTLTMRDALAKVKELEKDARDRKVAAAKAPTKFMQGIDSDAASRSATLARKLRDDIKQVIQSYPDAKAEYEVAQAATPNAGTTAAAPVAESPTSPRDRDSGEGAVARTQDGGSPAPNAGMIRLYHGGEPDDTSGALWFSTDRKYAEGYAKKSGAGVWYVDVLKSDARVKDLLPDPEFGTTPLTNINLPADLAAKRQRFRDAEPTAPKPASGSSAAATDGSAPESERYAAGRALTKAQRKQVLDSLVDVYKAKGADREQKGIGRDGNERYGYVHSPELFEKSDITGAMVRYYVTLPDGRRAHPTELFPDYTQADVDAALAKREADEKADRENQAGAEARADKFAAPTVAAAEESWKERNKGMPGSDPLRDWRTGQQYTLVTLEKGEKFYSVRNDDAALMSRLERGGWKRPDVSTKPAKSNTSPEPAQKSPESEQVAAADKPPELQTEAEFGAVLQVKAIADAELELKKTKAGMYSTLRFKSKAAAVRAAEENLANAKNSRPEQFAGDHLAAINRAIAQGKMPSAENIRRYDIPAEQLQFAASRAKQPAPSPAVQPEAEASAPPDRRRKAAEYVRQAVTKRTDANSAMVWQIIGPDGNPVSGPSGKYPGNDGPLAGSATMGELGWKTKREAEAALAELNRKADEILGVADGPTAKPAPLTTAASAGTDALQAAPSAMKYGEANKEAKRLTAETGTPHQAVNRERVDEDGFTVSEWFVEPTKAAPAGKPAPGRYVQPVKERGASREGQMEMANRASRIASLSALNDMVRQREPDAAYSDDEIQNAANIDAMQDWLSERGRAPSAKKLEGPRRDPAKVNPLQSPYNNGDIVTIGGKDWMVKQDMPGWYLTSDGTWRGEHPTIRGIKGMVELIRAVDEAAQEAAPVAVEAPKYPLAPAGTRYEESDKPVTMMSPDAYLAAVRPLTIDEASRDNIDDLKRHIQSGKTLDPLRIRADGKEDGRHRAVAARELGIKEVPVIDERTKPADDAGNVAMFSRAPAVRTALDKAIAAKAAFDAVDRASVVVKDADAYFALSQAASEARTQLADELAAQPDDGFVLQGRGFGGRLIMLNRSAQNAGQWQLTRFDGKEDPLGDSQYTTKAKALEDFLREIDLASLQDFDGAFSRSGDKSRSLPIDDAEAIAEIVRKANPTAPPIIVLDEVSKAPDSLLTQIRKAGAANDVEAAYHKGRIYVFPSNISTPERMMFVLAKHELRHAGSDALFGKRRGMVMMSIAMSNPKLAEAARQKMKDGHADSMSKGVEEALADMTPDEMVKLNGWDKIVAAVRQWLRDMAVRLERSHPKLAAALNPEAWTDKDIAALIQRAEDVSRKGTGVFGGESTAFGRAPEKIGTEEEARAQGYTLKAYRGASKANPFNDSGSTWLTTDREVAAAYAEEVMGYEDPDVLTVMVKPDDLPRHDASRLTDEQREELGADQFGNPQAVGIYSRSDDHPLGGSRRNVTVIHAPKDAVFLVRDSQQDSGTMFSRAAGASPVSAQDLVNSKGELFDFNRYGETRQDRIRSIIDKARKFWLPLMTRDQIADVYGDELPPVKDYDALTRAMENERQKLAQDADDVYQRWSKLSAQTNDKLARLMLDATLFQVHPDGEFNAIPGDKPARTVERRAAHNRLKQEWAALPDDGKAMYREVRDFHSGILEKLQAAVLGRLDRQVENGAAKAATVTAIRAKFDQYLKNGPYFPLSRFGDFLVIARRDDGERVVAAYENPGEQQAAARKLAADGFKVKLTTAKKYNRTMDGTAGKFIGDVLAMIDKLDFSEANIDSSPASLKAKMLDDVNQMFIKSMPDLSYRKHFAHRKGTPGFSSDMMRGFASSAFHAAAHISRLNHGDRMSFALEDAYSAIDNVDEGDFTKHKQVLDEMAMRHDAMLNPNTHPIASMLNAIGFTMYLGLSPAAGIINGLQTVMVTMPYLGARYGFTQTNLAMKKAYGDIMAAEFNKAHGFDATKSKKLTKAEQDMMKALQDEGVIDLTQAHDLASATGLDSGNVARSKAAFAMSKAMKIVGWTFHIPEVMNRQVTALMAYRMELAKSGNKDAAIEAAREAIKRTQFDYSQSNRARFMQSNLARVALQFRQFSQNMTYFLGRAFYNAIKGESPEVQAIARKQLAATFLTTWAFSGALGLPVVGTIGSMIGMLIGAADDDDEPFDWEVAFRNAAADLLGKEGGEVLSRGLPRLLPWDIASRTSLSDLWWRDNSREGDNPREAWTNAAMNILGPTAGTSLSLFTAADYFGKGDYLKGMEAMLPKALRDPIKALRESNEGVTSYSGQPLMETSVAEDIGQLLGFGAARKAEMYDAKGAVMNAKAALDQKRQRLLSEMVRARIDGDAEAVSEASEKIAAWNQRNPNERILPKNIVQSLVATRRNLNQTKDGIMLKRNDEYLRERGRFAAVE